MKQGATQSTKHSSFCSNLQEDEDLHSFGDDEQSLHEDDILGEDEDLFEDLF